MTLIDNWLEPGVARDMKKLDGDTLSSRSLSQTIRVPDRAVVQAIWDGSTLRVYCDGLSTSVIGDSMLSIQRFDPVLHFSPSSSRAPRPSDSTATLVSELKEASGLTWEQVARALGVSKRTVLLWASGARVSNKNHELILSLKALVDETPGDPETRRNSLLATRPDKPSALTAWVQHRTAADARMNAPVLRAHELMG